MDAAFVAESRQLNSAYQTDLLLCCVSDTRSDLHSSSPPSSEKQTKQTSLLPLLLLLLPIFTSFVFPPSPLLSTALIPFHRQQR